MVPYNIDISERVGMNEEELDKSADSGAGIKIMLISWLTIY